MRGAKQVGCGRWFGVRDQRESHWRLGAPSQKVLEANIVMQRATVGGWADCMSRTS